MSIYSLPMGPVPADTETYLGSSKGYMFIVLPYEYGVMASESYIQLNHQQLTLCNKMSAMYDCENSHVLRYGSEHKCA